MTDTAGHLQTCGVNALKTPEHVNLKKSFYSYKPAWLSVLFCVHAILFNEIASLLQAASLPLNLGAVRDRLTDSWEPGGF